MAIKFNRSQTFATNGTVTAAGLHNLVDGLDIYQALITDQTALTSVGTADKLLIADADLTAADAPRSVTVQELFDDSLTSGTYTQLNLTGNLTFGTATGNRTVSTNASITTGTINNATLGTTTATAGTVTNLTAGTTTSTAANITNGTIQTLTSSTATITGGTFSGLLNSSTGTFSGLTSGIINSTTGTITNLSTTLAGDFTISGGTGTLGTTGVTAGTYGTSTIIPQITVDAKGRVTSIGTSALGSTGKVLQVVSTTKTDVFSTTSTSFTDVTGLSASITPTSTSNKILVMVSGCAGMNSANSAAIKLLRGSTDISVGQTAAGYTSVSFQNFYGGSADGNNAEGFSIIFLDSPSSTSSLTYKIQAIVSDGTLVINGNGSDTSGQTYSYRSASSITLMEIAG